MEIFKNVKKNSVAKYFECANKIEFTVEGVFNDSVM